MKDVAAWAQKAAWDYSSDHADNTGFCGPGGRRQDTSAVAVAVAKVPTFPPLACYQGNAGDMGLPDDLTGWIIFFDPPYQGTSGYPFGTLDRVQVLQLAKEWHDRGAIVAISEAEPLPLDGWHHVQIDHARKGQKRTFSKQQSEWLTMNRPPHHVPAKQMALHSPVGHATL
jgi:hypothetical protein